MPEVDESKPQESVQEALQQIVELLEKQQLV